MKASNISRLVLALGLALIVAWLATFMTPDGAESFLGSWIWVGCDDNCDGETRVVCGVDEPFPADCGDDPTQVWVYAEVGYYTGSYCTGDDEYPCSGNWECEHAEDSYCG